ncbi:MAG TPA: response regulator transcription factor [Candidatus Dormibacteraeota bacterium]|nr:response regulator transcription factor [Candidatus Dormibacteraeota bacterium]
MSRETAVQQPVKVLVVDDELLIRQFLTTGLRYEGYEVQEAKDGSEALTLAARFQPDIVILDLVMPGTDGYEVCRRLRGRPDLGIVMLTAKDELHDRIQGLDMGADDYLVKPFEFDELLSRIRANLRRLNKPGLRMLAAGPLTMDEARHQVRLDGRILDLTPREFDLLRFLIRHPQQVFSRQVILDRVWGPDFLGGEGNVDVCIASLRSKLGPGHRAVLQTVRSVGFRLSP